MISYVRKKEILEKLKSNDLLYVDDIFKIFNGEISASTIRRDLKSLENENYIQLLRGGGIRLSTGSYELSLNSKKNINADAKEEIAKKAANIISEGEVIYIDSGSTALEIIKYLKDLAVTVVTTNTKVLEEINKYNLSDLKCILLGGLYNHVLESVSGTLTDEMLKTIYFDKSFLGVSGLSELSGGTTPDINEASKKKIIIKNSKKSYILADDSKFEKIFMNKFCDLSEVKIITNKREEFLNKAKEII